MGSILGRLAWEVVGAILLALIGLIAVALTAAFVFAVVWFVVLLMQLFGVQIPVA